jgi:hypothetical protein
MNSFAKVLLIIMCSFSSIAHGNEDLWANGKITPDQPFKGSIIAVKPGWGWDTIILKEQGGAGRYCFASIGQTLFYKIIDPKDFDQAKLIELGAVFITPAVEVDRFSWSMGVWEHGKRFGANDTATKFQSTDKKSGEQAGADQPATAPESKSEGKDKHQPEKEVAPR